MTIGKFNNTTDVQATDQQFATGFRVVALRGLAHTRGRTCIKEVSTE